MQRIVINLESRPDRRREMELELARVNWQAEFIKAERPADRGAFESIGARGCFLSHLKALRMAHGDLVLVEDDLCFADNFPDRWIAALKELPDDWDIFYPAHDTPAGMVPPSTRIMCTHLMMFRSRAIPQIIEGLEAIMSRPPGHPMGGPMHVDGAYSTIRRHNPGLMTYACSPPLGFQRPSKSDIATRSVFKELIRPAYHALRRFRSF